MKKRKIGTETAYGKEGPRILDISSIRLPISIARQVRQIDFLRVEEKEEDVVFYHPMIQIHPKDAPYHIKSVWLSMYERAQKDRKCWQHLFYKYGDDTFSLQDPSNIISFQEGCDKDYEFIPLNIMFKLRHGQLLSQSEVQVIEALEILKQEIKKDPKDRVAWLQDDAAVTRTMIQDDGNQDTSEGYSDGNDFWDCNEEDNHKDKQEDSHTGNEETDSESKGAMLDATNTTSLSQARLSNEVIDKDSFNVGIEGEQLKDDFYAKCRERVTSDFFRIGFALFDDMHYPVIQLDPCQMCPSLFTSRFFRSLKESGNNADTKRIVFWYGQDRCDETREISVVDEEDILSYYEGYSVVKEQDLDEDEKLFLQKSIQEAEKDLNLAPADRLSWFFDYEKVKRNQLSSIPPDIRIDFRRIGFVSHHGHILPVIQLSPFDVAGTVRENFLSEIRKGIQTKKNLPVKRLIYWYGTRERNNHEAFSFINPSKFICYEEGARHKYDQVPEKVQKKIESGNKLTMREKLNVDGLKQMHDDLKFSPIERPRYLLLPDDDDEVESIFLG